MFHMKFSSELSNMSLKRVPCCMYNNESYYNCFHVKNHSTRFGKKSFVYVQNYIFHFFVWLISFSHELNKSWQGALTC